MEQNQQNVVRLEGSRSIIGFLLFIVPTTMAVATFGIFLFSHAAKGGPDCWPSLGFGMLCMTVTALFVWMAIVAARKARDPDVMELSTDSFHYFSPVRSKDVIAPWDKVGAPAKRTSGKYSYLQVDIAGQPLSLDSGLGDLSMEAMIDLINSAREGHIVSPAEWLACHPEPNETKSALIGISVGLTGAALIGAIIVLTAHR